MNELESARAAIDRIDRLMAGLFEERMQTCPSIAAYKAARGLAVKDPDREKAIIERNLAYIHDPEIVPYYARFLEAVIGLSCDYQESLTAALAPPCEETP